MVSVQETGTALPDMGEGNVYSVHSHVINLQDVSRSQLISIVTQASDMTALSICTNSLPRALSPGTGYRIAGTALYSDGFQQPLIQWSPDTPTFSGRLPRVRVVPTVLAALGTVRTHLAATGSREGLLSVGLGERASNRYAEKALDIIESGPRDGLAGLLGLGPGFTPSGDDFVCGALAALAVFDPYAPVDPSPIIGRFRSAGPRAADITTLGGRTLVQLACRGSFPRYLEAFVLSAFSGTPSESDIESAVDALLAHGSTSGSDTLSGFLWATERPVT